MGSACRRGRVRRGRIENWRREQLGAESIHRAAIEVDHQIYRQSDLPALGTLDRQTEPTDEKAMLIAMASAQYDISFWQSRIETHGLAPAGKLLCDRHRFLPNAGCGVEILWKGNVQQNIGECLGSAVQNRTARSRRPVSESVGGRVPRAICRCSKLHSADCRSVAQLNESVWKLGDIRWS